MGKKFTMHSSTVPITTGIGFIDLVAVDDSCCCNNVNKFFNSVLVDWRGRWTNSQHQQVNRRDRRRFVSGTRWWLELNWNCARLYDGTRRRIQRESGLFFSYANEYPLPNFDPSGSLSPGSATGQQTLVAGSFWQGFSQWQCDVCDRSSMQMRKNQEAVAMFMFLSWNFCHPPCGYKTVSRPQVKWSALHHGRCQEERVFVDPSGKKTKFCKTSRNYLVEKLLWVSELGHSLVAVDVKRADSSNWRGWICWRRIRVAESCWTGCRRVRRRCQR